MLLDLSLPTDAFVIHNVRIYLAFMSMNMFRGGVQSDSRVLAAKQNNCFSILLPKVISQLIFFGFLYIV